MEQKKSYRIALYTRVSTVEQNSELQLRVRDLQSHADREGWQIVDTYQDIISGCNANRSGLTRLLADAHARKFDCLLVWKLDRFGRSLVDCLNNIRTLEDQACGLSPSLRDWTRTSATRHPSFCSTCWAPRRNSKGL
jgi:DNA invertase Pin-like site-specific DNA recombinase